MGGHRRRLAQRILRIAEFDVNAGVLFSPSRRTAFPHRVRSHSLQVFQAVHLCRFDSDPALSFWAALKIVDRHRLTSDYKLAGIRLVEGLLNKEIAATMGLKASYVTKLLQHWFDSRGLPRPDCGRGLTSAVCRPKQENGGWQPALMWATWTRTDRGRSARGLSDPCAEDTCSNLRGYSPKAIQAAGFSQKRSS